MDRETFLANARGWQIDPIWVGDDLAALVVRRDNEIHLCKLGNHDIQRQHLRTYLHPGVMTRIPPSLMDAAAFVRRLGFILAGHDRFGNHIYTLEGKPCQQQ